MTFPLVSLWDSNRKYCSSLVTILSEEFGFGNDGSIISRSYCERHLRNKDFSIIDNLHLIIIRHRWECFQFSTVLNNSEAKSEANIVYPSTYCQPPELRGGSRTGHHHSFHQRCFKNKTSSSLESSSLQAEWSSSDVFKPGYTLHPPGGTFEKYRISNLTANHWLSRSYLGPRNMEYFYF